MELPESVVQQARIVVDESGRHVKDAQPVPTDASKERADEITQHPALIRSNSDCRAHRRDMGEHLGTTIENAVRAGSHRIVLNFAEVQYISSLGISVLFQQYKLLKSVNEA